MPQNLVQSLIKVILASDNSHFLDQARAALAAQKGIAIVGEARQSEQVLQLLRERRPMLLLLNLVLPPTGGLPLLPQIRERSPKTRVLAVDDRLHEGRALRVAKGGGQGYMLAEAIPTHLSKAVRVMAAGEAWFSRSLMGKVIGELQRLIRLHERGGRPRRGRAPR